MMKSLPKNSLNNKTIAIFGGTGFLGKSIINQLAKSGASIIVPTRNTASVYDIKPVGEIGQINGIACRLSDDEDLKKIIDGADIVINLIGLLYESGKATFEALHHQFPKRLAEITKKANKKAKIEKRIIHISAIGVDEKSNCRYLKTKALGEKALLKNMPSSTILRPSIVYGPDDNFFNMFAKLSGFMPYLPLIGGGKTKFQPVYVEDIAKAVDHVIENSETKGETYALGGPTRYSFKELLEMMLEQTHRKKLLLPIPFPLAKIKSHILKLAPTPLLTPDQVEALKYDNVVPDGSKTLHDLGITPTALEIILPDYMVKYRPGGIFANKKRA